LSDAHAELIPQAVATERIHFTYTGYTDVIATPLVWLFRIKGLLVTTTVSAAILGATGRCFSCIRLARAIATTSGDRGIAAFTIETGIRRAGIPIIAIDWDTGAFKAGPTENTTIENRET